MYVENEEQMLLKDLKQTGGILQFNADIAANLSIKYVLTRDNQLVSLVSFVSVSVDSDAFLWNEQITLVK